MANEKRSFEELLKEAPKAPAADTVSVVGTLAQSSEKGKFVLTLGSGQAVALDVSAVKGHEVLGSSVGHTVVRVDLERASLPAGLAEGTTAAAADTARALQTVPAIDTINTLPVFDHFPTTPLHDWYPTVAWLDHKPPPVDIPWGTIFNDPIGTLQEGAIPDPTGGGVNPVAAAMPFSLAAQHQAAPSVLAQHTHLPKVMHDPWKMFTDGTSPWLREYRDY